MKTDAPWPDAKAAEARVLGIQTKLHQWATDEQARRFCDLDNLVGDPALLLVGWRRVKGNKGARSAGVEGQTAYDITAVPGEEAFLAELRADLKARRVVPLPVRERLIPKPGGTKRRLGIATIGTGWSRPRSSWCWSRSSRRTFTRAPTGSAPGAGPRTPSPRSTCWQPTGMRGCWKATARPAWMRSTTARSWAAAAANRGQARGGLGQGVRQARHPQRGWGRARHPHRHPQGGILSPLLANIALSVLDNHAAQAWAASGTPMQRHRRRQRGEATWRLVRYADDVVVMVAGSKPTPRRWGSRWPRCWPRWGCTWPRPRQGPATSTRLRLPRVRHPAAPKARHGQALRLHLPVQEGLGRGQGEGRALTRGTTNQTLAALRAQLNLVLRGWTTYFRHSVAKATYSYLCRYVRRRVTCWLRHKLPASPGSSTAVATCQTGGRRRAGCALPTPPRYPVTRYRYRGTPIPTPWTSTTRAPA